MSSSPDPETLVLALDSDDAREQRRAGDELAALGADAIPPLIQGLRAGSPRVRKSTAYLLGRTGRDGRAADALAFALGDDEPKVRKNAAVSLGRLGRPEAVEPLALALAAESVGWVRASLILALGAVGGDRAREVLAETTPTDDSERGSLRKALDKLSPHERLAAWRKGWVWKYNCLVAVPPGLENVALAEARANGVGTLVAGGDGRLLARSDAPPWDLIPRMRCIHAVYVRAGEGPRPTPDDPHHITAVVRTLLEESLPLRELHEWVDDGGEPLRYRFSLEGMRLRRDDLRSLLVGVRSVCAPLGLLDSPSRYDLELVVQLRREGSELLIRPSFVADDRFTYRRRDVGASINPVIGACLARLAGEPGEGTTLDPVCGSGTLLIERAILAGGETLVGMDVSTVAVSAAQENVRAAGLEARLVATRGDARDPDRWPECDRAIANLPFGLRTGRTELDLPELYMAVLSNIAQKLRPGGRAVLYTADRRTLDSTLAAHRDRLLVLQRLHADSGGIRGHIWVLGRR